MAKSNFPGAPTDTLMRIAVSDAVLDQYEAEAKLLGVSPESLLKGAVERLAGVPRDERIFLVRAADREALEKALKRPLKDAAALVTAVKAVMTISIGGVKLDLEPWQHAELKRRAEKNGTSPQQETEKAMRQMASLIFSSTP